MKRFGISILLVICSLSSWAQSKTTQELHDKNKEALSLFFYKNTLRMINQTDSKEFDELINDIEKMKFLMISKAEAKIGPSQYKALVGDYKKEGYEEIITSRMEGKSFDVYLKEKNGKTAGTIVLVNDDKDLYILDILGSIPINKVPEFFKKMDESSEVGKMIKNFTKGMDKDKDDDKSKHSDDID